MDYGAIGLCVGLVVIFIGLFIEIKEIKQVIHAYLDDALEDMDVEKTIFCKIFCESRHHREQSDFIGSFLIGFLILMIIAMVSIIAWPVIPFIFIGWLYCLYLKKEKELRKFKKQKGEENE